MGVSSLRHPACKAHVPYSVICGLYANSSVSQTGFRERGVAGFRETKMRDGGPKFVCTH